MAEQNGNGADAPQAGPKFSVLAQYTKDLSFENPNAPRTLGPQQTPPNISIQINVNARQLAPSDYEVSLMLEGGAGPRRRHDVQVRAQLRRRFPGGELSRRAGPAGGHDRGPANLVSLRAPNRCGRGARRVVSAALYRSDRFSGALSAETGCGRRSTAATDGLIFPPTKSGRRRRRQITKPDRIAAEAFNKSNVGAHFGGLDRRLSSRPLGIARSKRDRGAPRRVRQRRQT